MSNKILVEVKEIEEDNKPHLRFIYQDKLIEPENTYLIFDDGDGRYIERKERKCFLIDSDVQIESRIEEKKGDFTHCIFLIGVRGATFTEKVGFGGAIFTLEANFEKITFTKEIGFSGATFVKQARFSGAIFTKRVGFWCAEFTEQANFGDTKFTEQADFGYAKFTKQADFGSATFTEQADFERTIFAEQSSFSGAIFTKEAYFKGAIFTKEAYFKGAVFIESAIFLGARFTEQANFRGATFSQRLIDFEQAQFLTALNLNYVKSITLNLYQSQLDKIYYDTDCKFSADNRETFLILKSIALKQHDKIKALEFHTQEYKQHLKDICPQVITDICPQVIKKILAYCAKKLPFKLPFKLSFKSENWIILGFEKVVSNFGTSVSRSVSWYFGFAVLFYLFMNGFNIDTKTIINFIIPTNIAVGDFLINCDSDTDTACVNWYHYILFAIYKFGQIVLLYEIIKSFRKYSRSL